MTQQEIKEECEKIYAQTKLNTERLKTLREVCKHETIFEGNWSWRIGNIQPAIICSDCGNLIKYKDCAPIPVFTSTTDSIT